MNEPHERPKIAQEPISVLLPVYNQAAGVEPIANAWLRELDRLDRPYEFIVIDDHHAGSTGILGNGSIAAAELAADPLTNTQLLHHPL